MKEFIKTLEVAYNSLCRAKELPIEDYQYSAVEKILLAVDDLLKDQPIKASTPKDIGRLKDRK